MPRVPQVDLPSVGMQTGMSPQFQAPQVTPMRDFTGQQIEQFGQGMAQLGAGAIRLEDRINDAKASEATAELAEFRLAAWNDYKRNLGKNAIDTKQQYLEDLDKKRQEIGSRLDNGFQQDAFARAASYHTLQFREDVDRHFEDQSKAYFIGTREAKIRANQGLYGETQQEELFLSILADTNFIADELQYDPQDPRRLEMQQNAKDAAHIAALGQMTGDGQNRNIGRANDYFAAKQNDMSPALRAKVREQLDKMNQSDNAETVSQSLRQMLPSLGQQIAAAEEGWRSNQYDAETLNLIRTRLTQANAQQRDAKNQAVLETQDSLMREIDRTRASGQTLDQLYASNPALRLSVENTGQESFAEEYFARGAMKATPTGDLIMAEIVSNPTSLQGQKWTDIMVQTRRFVTPSQLEKLEAMWVTQNAGLPGSGIPGTGKRVSDANKIITDDQWLDMTIREQFGVSLDVPINKMEPKDRATLELVKYRMSDTMPDDVMRGKTENWRQDVLGWIKTHKERTVQVDGEAKPAFMTTKDELGQAQYQYKLPTGESITKPVAEFAEGTPLRAKAMALAQARFNQMSEQQKLSAAGQDMRLAARGENDYVMAMTYLEVDAQRGADRVVQNAKDSALLSQASAYLDSQYFPTKQQLSAAIGEIVGPDIATADPWTVTQTLFESGLLGVSQNEWSNAYVRRASLTRVEDAIRQYTYVDVQLYAANRVYERTLPQAQQEAAAAQRLTQAMAPLNERLARAADQRVLDASIQRWVNQQPQDQLGEILASPRDAMSQWLATDTDAARIAGKYTKGTGEAKTSRGIQIYSFEAAKDGQRFTVGRNLITDESLDVVIHRYASARIKAANMQRDQQAEQAAEKYKADTNQRAVEAIRKMQLRNTPK